MFRHDPSAQFTFKLAEQQGVKVSSLLGFRKNDDPMSFNEMEWWQAYACCRPLSPDRLDMFEARLVGSWCGKDPALLKMDWFSKELDIEWCKERDEADRKRIAKLQEKLNKELAEKEAQNAEAD